MLISSNFLIINVIENVNEVYKIRLSNIFPKRISKNIINKSNYKVYISNCYRKMFSLDSDYKSMS